MKRTIFLYVSFIALCVCLSAGTASAVKSGGKTYKLAVKITSTGGLGAGQSLDMILKLMKKIEEKTGFKIEVVRVDEYEEAVAMFLRGKIDIMPIWPSQYITLTKNKAKILPIVTMTIDGQTKRAQCFWSIRDSGIGSIRDIIGKTHVTIVQEDHTPYISMRYYLKANNIDRALWDVFSGFAITPNQNSMFMALALKKADVSWATTDEKVLMRAMNAQVVAKLRPVFCTDYVFDRWAFVANGKTMSPEDYKKIILASETILKHVNDDKDFKPFLPLARMIKAGFKIAPQIEFKTEEILEKEAQKYGWLDEARYFIARINEIPAGKVLPIPPPKKPAPECRKECRKNKNIDACVDACMR